MTNEPDISKLVDNAFAANVSTPKEQYQSPDQYKEKTGKRFRLSKAEIALHGSSKDGRQAAFMARQQAGKLE